MTSLAHLPFEKHIDMYIFSVGDNIWEGGLPEIVHRNFDKIAKEIGPDAIIVGALQDKFYGEVVHTYLGKNYKELKNLMPALLITDSHPSKLCDESFRMVIPLREVHKHYEIIDSFLNDLTAFIRHESDELLRQLEDSCCLASVAGEVVDVTIPVIPGVVAVNIGGVVHVLRRWW